MSKWFSNKMIFSALGILLLWFTIPFTAFAHTSLESAVPAKDAKVEEAVSDIQMSFNTPIAELSSFTVVSPQDKSVTINNIKVEGSSMSGQPSEPLTSGTYTVQWKIVGEDSHPIEGSYAFTVNAAASLDSSENATPAAESDASSADAGTSSTNEAAEDTSTSATTESTEVQNPAPATSTESTTSPAEDATTDQQPAANNTVSGDEPDSEGVSPATWIITIAVVLIAVIAAVTTISKRRKR